MTVHNRRRRRRRCSAGHRVGDRLDVWSEVHNVGALRRRFVDTPCRNQEHEGTQPHDEYAAPSHSHFDARPRASVPIAARSARPGWLVTQREPSAPGDRIRPDPAWRSRTRRSGQQTMSGTGLRLDV
jgi:hypothetical protein